MSALPKVGWQSARGNARQISPKMCKAGAVLPTLTSRMGDGNTPHPPYPYVASDTLPAIHDAGYEGAPLAPYLFSYRMSRGSSAQ